MADDKGINIPVTLDITGIKGDIDLNELKPRKNQFPKRKNSNRYKKYFLRCK